MSLVTLRQPIPSFTNAMRRFEGRAIVYDPRLFVMSPALIRFNRSAVSELLAFQFAKFIEMPLPPFTGFWCPEPVFTGKGWSKPDRIGLALAWDGEPLITGGWCNRARRRPNTITKALVLSVMRCAYDVRMATTTGARYVAFDLGGLFPAFDSEWANDLDDPYELEDLCAGAAAVYLTKTEPKLDSVLRDVEQYRLVNRFNRIVERVLDAPHGALEECFDLGAHPMADQIRDTAVLAVRERFAAVYEVV